MGPPIPGRGNPGDGCDYQLGIVMRGRGGPTVNGGYLLGKNRSDTPGFLSGTI